MNELLDLEHRIESVPTTSGKTVFILGISGDIGRELAERYLKDGYFVVGTYRKKLDFPTETGRVHLLPCGQDGQYWLDSSAIKQDVGWEAQISLEEGIQEMIAWGRKYLPQLRNWSTDYIVRT